MDWIEAYMQSVEGIRSPPIFKLWAGLVTLSGVLQRRVYTYTKASSNPCCPNLWIALVGPPATGKGNIIRETRTLWGKTRSANGQSMFIASDNVNSASFVTEFETSVRTFMNGTGELHIFCSMAAAIREFGVFFPKYDMEFLSILSDLYDNLDQYRDARVTVESRKIDRPNFNMLAGVTPDFMSDIFPEGAWGQGFTSRLIFIYSDLVKFDNSGYFKKNIPSDNSMLVSKLSEFFDLGGEFEWSTEAQDAHIAWMDAGCPGAPKHSRLKHYASRRDIQVMKLAMISAVSAGRGLYIDIEDYTRAHEWLLEAELVMPDVFHAMGQKSDNQIIMDLWEHIYRMWARVEHNKRVPIRDKELWLFLQGRVPSGTIPRIIEAAERSGVLKRGPSIDSAPTWVPRPLTEHKRI